MDAQLEPQNTALAIYFPYSENFANSAIVATLPVNSKFEVMFRPVVVNTDREADEVPGREPYYCLTGGVNNVCYRNILVNDAFAEQRATHIVTIGAEIHQPDTNPVLKSEMVTRAYHGTSRLTRQMDKLISFTGNGGGSEIKVCRINSFLKTTEEHITDFAGDIVTVHYTRADIRKQRWKRVFSVWDPNWNYQDIEQIYAVYEDDNKGSKTFSGTLKTTISLPGKLGKGEGDVGYKIVVSSQDEIITQRKMDRKSYLRDGLNNQGWGFIEDGADFLPAKANWPVFDGGSIWQYTFPYRIF
jgi:hypothetical protein